MLKMHQKPDRPDPLGSLSAPPYPLAAIWGLLLRGGEENGGKRKEREKGEPPTTLSGYATEGRD